MASIATVSLCRFRCWGSQKTWRLSINSWRWADVSQQLGFSRSNIDTAHDKTHIRPYFAGIFPCIAITYALYMVGTSSIGSWHGNWYCGWLRIPAPVENGGKHPIIYRLSTCFNHPKLVVCRISQPSTVFRQLKMASQSLLHGISVVQSFRHPGALLWKIP